MEIKWHSLDVSHEKCNRDSQILEVQGRADGHLLLVCLCISCGEQFGFELTFAQLVANCVVQDIKEHQRGPDSGDMLANYNPRGKPN